MEFSETEGLEKDDDGSDSEMTMAHQAAMSGDIELLVETIKVDPSLLEQQDGEGLTPLARAVMFCQLEAVKRLVKMGASIHTQDELGRTVLAMAAYQGWYDGLVFLLRNGAKQNVCDKAGRTPLHAATYNKDPRTLHTLLSNVSTDDISIADNEGMTALHWTSFHDRPEHLQMLLEKGADINVEDIDGKTALHWAAQNGSLKCCQAVLQSLQGQQLINKIDHSGKSAVHFAVAAGHLKILKLLVSVPGCDLEPEDPDERTPLHWAAATGQAESVRILLQLGVNPEPVDAEGGTPLDYTKQAGHAECIHVFEQHLGLQKSSQQQIINQVQSSSKSHSQSSSRNPFSFIVDLFSKKKSNQSENMRNATSGNNTDRTKMGDKSNQSVNRESAIQVEAERQKKGNKDKNSLQKTEPQLEKLHLSRLDNPKTSQHQLGDIQDKRKHDFSLGAAKPVLPNTPGSGYNHEIRSPAPVLGNPVVNDIERNQVHATSPRPQKLAPLRGAPKLGVLPPSLMHEKVAALKREASKQRSPTPPATLEQVLESQARNQRRYSLSSPQTTPSISSQHPSNHRHSLPETNHSPSPVGSDISQRKKSKRKNTKHQSVHELMFADGNSLSDEHMAYKFSTDAQNIQPIKMRSSPRLELEETNEVHMSTSPQSGDYKQQRMDLDKHLQSLLY